jgi:hypothetical protein
MGRLITAIPLYSATFYVFTHTQNPFLMNNYWIMRTDRRTDEIRAFIWQELQQGRLRQGWAWKDEQSLTVIDSMANTDMTDEQKESWRGNRRMLQSHGDGIKPGDII